MKTRWIVLLAGLFVVLGSACSDDDGDGSGSGADAGDDTADMSEDVEPETLPYAYVLILDQESTDTGGMELDAVALVKGGDTHYADAFYEYIAGPGIDNVTTTRDANMALGAPNNEAGDCLGSDTFYVNLGGVGGSIIVSFNELTEINTGDTIRVYECGTVADAYRVRVGVATAVADPNWVVCLDDASGVAECVVPELPPVVVETME